MTWRPTPALLARCKRHVEKDTGVLDIPMRVTVPDQVLPVEFHVRINLTTSDLDFEPPSLDFGSIVMGQAGGINMRITNKSALPQKIGFLQQPLGVKVDCTASLLPGETITRLVTFTPPTDGSHRQVLECKSLVGRTFRIPVTAIGLKPALRLSSNFVVTSATMVDDVTSSSLILTNTTKVQSRDAARQIDSSSRRVCLAVYGVSDVNNIESIVVFTSLGCADASDV
jgi:hypothetical protein